MADPVSPAAASTGIVRASALPALARVSAPPVPRPRPPAIAPAQPVARGGAGWLHLLAPLRSHCMRLLAFDAAVLGALVSFVTELLSLGAVRGAVEGGRAMLLAALSLTACWTLVLGADARRLLVLLRRWR